jgi:hypothetical protein
MLPRRQGMEIKLYAMTCGHLTGDLGNLLEGGEGADKAPDLRPT